MKVPLRQGFKANNLKSVVIVEETTREAKAIAQQQMPAVTPAWN